MAINATNQEISDAVNAYMLKYAGKNNPVGKDHIYFTSADLAKVDSEMLRVVRSIINTENYPYIDKLVPKNMDRAEFTRAVLRELARRGEVAYPYNTFPTNKPELQNTQITVERFPFYVQDAKAEKVTERVGNIAIHDGFVDIAQNNSAAIRLISDVGSKVGVVGGRAYPIDTDAEAFDFGYTVGAQQAFRQKNGLKLVLFVTPTREETEQLIAAENEIKKGKTPDQIAAIQNQIDAATRQKADALVQQKYCRDVATIFEPGNAISNKEAMIRGFTQARVDIRTDFDPANDRIGLYGDCPSNKAQGR